MRPKGGYQAFTVLGGWGGWGWSYRTRCPAERLRLSLSPSRLLPSVTIFLWK